MYLNSWIVNLVLENFPPRLPFPSVLLFLASVQSCCSSSGAAVCLLAAAWAAFGHCFFVSYQSSTYVRLLCAREFFVRWIFWAWLYFLSLTVFSKPGVPVLGRYRQSVTGNNTCNIVHCTRRSCNCGSIGRLTVDCWNWLKLFSTKYLSKYHRILKIVGLPVRMPLFIISKIGFWKICFSAEMKCEELEEQEGKCFSDFVQMQEHKNIGNFTDNVNFLWFFINFFFSCSCCLHGVPKSRSLSVPREIRIL